jgi:Na+/melibiose symporter-like transporter
MQFKQTPEQQQRDLKYYILEGVTWAVMYYIGVVFLVPYLITLKANTLQIGLLNTLPLFLASFSVLFSYSILKYFKSEKHFILFFTILQAFFWIPLAIVGYLFNDKLVIWLVILFYCLITLVEQFPVGVYREWIGKIFNTSKIVEYNSRKQIILNLFSILPLFLAGFVLDSIHKNPTIGFTFIFIIAGIFRFGSYMVMKKMSQTEDQDCLCKESKERSKPVFKVFKEVVLKNKQFVYFLLIVTLIYFSMYVAAPYYRYYFLEILNFSYKQYVFLEIASILGLVLSFYYWGKICDKYGSTKVLKAIILFLPIYPFLVILFGSNVWLLFFLNVLDGALMAGLTLGIFGYFYQNIKSDLIHHMSFFLIFQSGAMLLGTLLGGIISSNPRFWLFGSEKYGLLLIFGISIVFRLFTIGFVGKIKDQNPNRINLPKNILLQKPIIFGLNQFLNFTKEEGKTLEKGIKQEENELKKQLIKQGKVIEKNIKTLANKEKQLFEKLTQLNEKEERSLKKKK